MTLTVASKRVVASLIAVLLTSMLGACASKRDQNITVLSYASPYSPGHPFSVADITWMKWVEKESQGTIHVQPYWSGSILSSESSMAELRHGVADIGLITPIYARGGTHLIRVQAGFYAGLTTFEQQVALYRCMVSYDSQFNNELHDLVVLAVQGGNLPGIVTRERAINTLEDLNGLRLRAPSELLGVLKRFGADPIDMPMGEVYSALAKGVLDGVVAPPDALRSLHFGEVAKHFNTIAIPRGAYAARAMGIKRWNTLTPSQQDLLRRGEKIWEAALAKELKKANDAGEKAGHEQHMEFSSMPTGEQEKFLAVYNELAEENAKHLTRYSINGLDTYRYARKVVDQIRNGVADCQVNQFSPLVPGNPNALSPFSDAPHRIQTPVTADHRDHVDATATGNIHG
ncbi:MAG TPA: TRAP transporter substrate-binding protein DctP [Steroidobacteraceae bacterium]|nr:TRAP transporter substrate-binding protein DctP [Steroidobacteraceae bacterium]